MSPLFQYRHLVFSVLTDSDRLSLAAAKITLVSNFERPTSLSAVEYLEDARMVYYVEINRDPFLPLEGREGPEASLTAKEISHALTVYAEALQAQAGNALRVERVDFFTGSPYQFGTHG